MAARGDELMGAARRDRLRCSTGCEVRTRRDRTPLPSGLLRMTTVPPTRSCIICSGCFCSAAGAA